MKKTLYFIFLLILLNYHPLSFSQSVVTLDGLAKIPLDIYKSREPNSPTIVYAHGCSGYDNHDIKKARLLRSWGYNVVVAEYTRGRGLAYQKGYSGRNITCDIGSQVYPESQRADDLIAVAKWVLEQEWHKGKIGAIGFSLGGSAVENLIQNTTDNNPFSVGVSFYPNCRVDLKPNEKTLPNQFHIASLDMFYSKCLRSNSIEKRHNIFTYENVTHAFDNDWDGINRNGYLYDKEATKIAYARVKKFFDDELKNK